MLRSHKTLIALFHFNQSAWILWLPHILCFDTKSKSQLHKKNENSNIGIQLVWNTYTITTRAFGFKVK